MYKDRHILAVVPARAGSKGIPNKNLQMVGGRSLIAWAGQCLAEIGEIDARIISTDSPAYAAEAQLSGLDAFFLRPPELSSDGATAVDTMLHALATAEAHYALRFDVLLIVEPTSPLRMADDIRRSLDVLISTNADSVVTVSPLNPKWHPDKLLKIDDDRLAYYTAGGASITGRQMLRSEYYWRNGACYALTRETLIEKRAIITNNSGAVLIDRVMINIDDPLELAVCDLLIRSREQMVTT